MPQSFNQFCGTQLQGRFWNRTNTTEPYLNIYIYKDLDRLFNKRPDGSLWCLAVEGRPHTSRSYLELCLFCQINISFRGSFNLHFILSVCFKCVALFFWMSSLVFYKVQVKSSVRWLFIKCNNLLIHILLLFKHGVSSTRGVVL